MRPTATTPRADGFAPARVISPAADAVTATATGTTVGTTVMIGVIIMMTGGTTGATTTGTVTTGFPTAPVGTTSITAPVLRGPSIAIVAVIAAPGGN